MMTPLPTSSSPHTYSSPVARASSVERDRPAREHLETEPDVTSTIQEQSVFENAVISFIESQWQVQRPLFYITLQRTRSPCEASQTFHAICMQDSSGRHTVGKEAVVKIKFQVQADEETIDLYQYYIDEHKKDLMRHPSRADEINAAIVRVQKALRKCTQPTKKPNEATLYELKALNYLTEKKCSSTPRLLDLMRDHMDSASQIHRKAVAGGFLVAILMTKVPGRPLDAGYPWSLSTMERESLREDFKTALLDVLKCGLECRETGLYNLKWDQKERKCYIVDLEHSVFASTETREKLEFDNEEEYKDWGLAKDYYV